MKQKLNFDSNGVSKCSFDITEKYEYIDYQLEASDNNMILYIYMNGKYVGGTWERKNRISTYNSSSWFTNCSEIGKLEFIFEFVAGNIEQSFTINIEVGKTVKRYYKIDTHVHTTESDGSIKPQNIAGEIKNLGYEAAFLTDHNAISQNYIVKGKKEIPIFAGIEFTTRKGHINVLGISPQTMVNLDTQKEFYKSLEIYKSQGGLISLNHPFDDTCPSCYFKWGIEDVSCFDTVEIWNHSWFSHPKNYLSFNQKCLEWWQQQLVDGHKIFAIAGTDYHGSNDGLMYGKRQDEFYPVLNVFSDGLRADSLLEGIRNGRSYITKRGEEVLFDLSLAFGGKFNEDSWCFIKNATSGDVLKIITENAVDEVTLVDEYEVILKEYISNEFVRFEIWRKEESLIYPIAITNPVFSK